MDNSAYDKSATERIFYSVLYEVLAIVLTAPVMALAFNRSVLEMGGLSIIVSTCAMLWNVVFNYFFDKFLQKRNLEKDTKMRVWHGIGFEVGLLILTVPIAALYLGDLKEGFLSEVGLLIFFFPYTIIYSWCYDHIREWVVNKKQAKLSQQSQQKASKKTEIE
ncbi:MAG: PACE efflux transporter [Neisseriaceae bacterium]|nr:PACE efflux transporter [Neisseriaceae bacterium]